MKIQKELFPNTARKVTKKCLGCSNSMEFITAQTKGKDLSFWHCRRCGLCLTKENLRLPVIEMDSRTKELINEYRRKYGYPEVNW